MAHHYHAFVAASLDSSHDGISVTAYKTDSAAPDNVAVRIEDQGDEVALNLAEAKELHARLGDAPYAP